MMDDIHARRAIDKKAALAVSSSEAYLPKKICGTTHTYAPPETREPNPCERGNSSFTDLTGYKFGRFTVVGLCKHAIPAKWVVRCVCGAYSTRKAKAIKNPNNSLDRCEHCRHLAHLKRTEFFLRTGRDVPYDEL